MKKVETEGYTVKSVKQGDHTHGRWFTGNLYNGSVKIAEFEEHGWGGPMDIHIKDADMYENFVSFAKILEDEEYNEIDAILIEDMVNSFFDRKTTMTARKKKTFFGVESDLPNEYRFINNPYSETIVDFIYDTYGEEVKWIANELFDIYPDGVDRVFREE